MFPDALRFPIMAAVMGYSLNVMCFNVFVLQWLRLCKSLITAIVDCELQSAVRFYTLYF